MESVRPPFAKAMGTWLLLLWALGFGWHSNSLEPVRIGLRAVGEPSLGRDPRRQDGRDGRSPSADMDPSVDGPAAEEVPGFRTRRDGHVVGRTVPLSKVIWACSYNIALGHAGFRSPRASCSSIHRLGVVDPDDLVVALDIPQQRKEVVRCVQRDASPRRRCVDHRKELSPIRPIPRLDRCFSSPHPRQTGEDDLAGSP
jgi:hypothetical protein